jgi:hypothetical protein
MMDAIKVLRSEKKKKRKLVVKGIRGELVREEVVHTLYILGLASPEFRNS